jgi:hypothetical protein
MPMPNKLVQQQNKYFLWNLNELKNQTLAGKESPVRCGSILQPSFKIIKFQGAHGRQLFMFCYTGLVMMQIRVWQSKLSFSVL